MVVALFLFLKGMTGALAPFSYLVYNNILKKFVKKKFCGYGPWGCIHNTSFSSQPINGPSKLECCIELGWKGLLVDKHSSLLGPLVSYKE